MHCPATSSVRLRLAMPSAPLRRYVSGFIHADIVCSPGGRWLEDWQPPEWASLRFLTSGDAQAATGPAKGEDASRNVPQAWPAFGVTGPTSHAVRLRLGSGRHWRIGLLPLGWARLIGAPASDYADRLVDGARDDACAALWPLAAALAASDGDHARDLALIEAHLAQALAVAPVIHEPPIAALTAALADPDMLTVADLAARLGMTVRTAERLSARVFGFAPKLLLRRQRFLRSLARFMGDPSRTWLRSLDCHYHDQSHFVRDFRRFMGMCPSAYAKAHKPLLTAAAQARIALAGAAAEGPHAFADALAAMEAA